MWLVEHRLVAFPETLKCGISAAAAGTIPTALLGCGPDSECLTCVCSRSFAHVGRLTVVTSEQEQAEMRLEFARLKQDHADFDAAINAMIATGCDPLRIQRMKKKKLALKTIENGIRTEKIGSRFWKKNVAFHLLYRMREG